MTTANNPENQNSKAAQGSGQINPSAYQIAAVKNHIEWAKNYLKTMEEGSTEYKIHKGYIDGLTGALDILGVLE